MTSILVARSHYCSVILQRRVIYEYNIRSTERLTEIPVCINRR